MAWSWSHTDSAYVDAEYNLCRKPLEWLQVCWAEIKAASCEYPYTYTEFDREKYTAALEQARKREPWQLTSEIWTFASEQRLCTNGGWELYMCPFGCHTVKPDKGE